MVEVKARTLKKLASFRLSDGTLEVDLVEFTRLRTGDRWVKRVVGYVPDGRQYPTERMYLDPPRNQAIDVEEEPSMTVEKEKENLP